MYNNMRQKLIITKLCVQFIIIGWKNPVRVHVWKSRYEIDYYLVTSVPIWYVMFILSERPCQIGNNHEENGIGSPKEHAVERGV